MLIDKKLHASYSSRGINLQRLDAIKKYAGYSILDVGCGSGAYVLDLSEKYETYGVDYQEFQAWSAIPEKFSISDASSLSFEDNSVDTLLSFETLEHLNNPLETLKEFYRVCKKNIIITVPNCELSHGMKKSKLLYYHWIDRTHVNFYSMKAIEDLVIDAGFKIEDKCYINQLNLSPFLEEVFDFSGMIGRLIFKLFLKRQKAKYHLTCLIVASKS